jgi:Tol biopolymer transport system component
VVVAAALSFSAIALSNAPATFPGNNGKIVFSKIPVGEDNFEIYSMNPDGTGMRRLTHSPKNDLNPSVSAGGTKIVWNRGVRIYKMDINGSNEEFLRAGRNPSWAPSGQQIAFEDDGIIFKMRSDGSNVTQLSESPGIRSDKQPAWSPDGDLIAFVRCCDPGDYLYKMKPDGSNEKLIGLSGVEGDEPGWAPNGQRIVYTGCCSNIYTLRLDGTGQRQLTQSNDDHSAAWAPDGDRIVYAHDTEMSGILMTVRTDGIGKRDVPNSDRSWLPDWQAR